MKAKKFLLCTLAVACVGCTASTDELSTNGSTVGTTTTTGGSSAGTTTGGVTTGGVTTGGVTTGGGTTAGGTTTGGTTGTLSASAQRKANAMAALGQFCTGLPHTSPDADNQQVLTYLQSSSSDFQNATLTGGVISTFFFDGEPYLYINNQPYPTQLSTAAVLAAETPTNTTGMKVDKAASSGKHFVVVNGLPLSDFDQTLVANTLLAPTLQYCGNALGSVSFTSLNANSTTSGLIPYSTFTQSFQNVDVLLWSGHGGLSPVSGLCLGAPLDPATLDLSNEDSDHLLENGDVIRIYTNIWSYQGVNPVTATPMFKYESVPEGYGITPTFFQHHATFQPSALAVIDTCDSTLSPLFTQASGASSPKYMAGWNNEANFQDMAETTQVFFDEFLGNNALWAQYHSVTAPSRPWPYATTVSDLAVTQRKNPAYSLPLVGSTYPLNESFSILHVASELIFSSLDGSDTTSAGLRPSLRGVAIQEPSGATIFGAFPATQGSGDQVTYNGSALSVTSWSGNQITCTGLPASGGGNVTVTAGGVQSNSVPITEWSWTSLLTVAQQTITNNNTQYPETGNISGSVASSFKLRCDVHGARLTPQGPIEGVTDASVGSVLAVGLSGEATPAETQLSASEFQSDWDGSSTSILSAGGPLNPPTVSGNFVYPSNLTVYVAYSLTNDTETVSTVANTSNMLVYSTTTQPAGYSGSAFASGYDTAPVNLLYNVNPSTAVLTAINSTDTGFVPADGVVTYDPGYYGLFSFGTTTYSGFSPIAAAGAIPTSTTSH